MSHHVLVRKFYYFLKPDSDPAQNEKTLCCDFSFTRLYVSIALEIQNCFHAWIKIPNVKREGAKTVIICDSRLIYKYIHILFKIYLYCALNKDKICT